MSAHEFRVGMKVVWIGKRNPGVWRGLPYRETSLRLSASEIYTIRWLGDSTFLNSASTPAVRLNEVRRSFTNGLFDDWPFALKDFRPLEDDHYDISIFQNMCIDAEKRQPVNSHKE